MPGLETCYWRVPSLELLVDFPKVSAKACDVIRKVILGTSAQGSLLLAMLDYLLLESRAVAHLSDFSCPCLVKICI